MSYSEIIGRWPTAASLAEACNKARSPNSPLPAVTAAHVRSWRHRNLIPPARWSEVATAAAAWKFGDITESSLNALYSTAPASHGAGGQAAAPTEFG